MLFIVYGPVKAARIQYQKAIIKCNNSIVVVIFFTTIHHNCLFFKGIEPFSQIKNLNYIFQSQQYIKIFNIQIFLCHTIVKESKKRSQVWWCSFLWKIFIAKSFFLLYNIFFCCLSTFLTLKTFRITMTCINLFDSLLFYIYEKCGASCRNLLKPL